jgi:hypothetical protein
MGEMEQYQCKLPGAFNALIFVFTLDHRRTHDDDQVIMIMIMIT